MHRCGKANTKLGVGSARARPRGVLVHRGCCRAGVALGAELGVLEARGQFLWRRTAWRCHASLKQLFQNRLEL